MQQTLRFSVLKTTVVFCVAAALAVTLAGCATAGSKQSEPAVAPTDVSYTPVEETEVTVDTTTRFGDLVVPISSEWVYENADTKDAEQAIYHVDGDRGVCLHMTRVVPKKDPQDLLQYNNYEELVKSKQEIFKKQNIAAEMQEVSVAGYTAVWSKYLRNDANNNSLENHEYFFLTKDALYFVSFYKPSADTFDLNALEQAVVSQITEAAD